MKPVMPWSVKGIEPEIREAAKVAARKSGMTLGEWLNSAISDQADGPSVIEGTPRPMRAPHNDSFDRAASRLEDIAQQLATIARRETGAAPTAYQSDARSQDSEQFTRILTRVESNERQTVEAFTAVNERLTTLGRQVTHAIKSRDTEESPNIQALEKAVRNIVEHLETSEKRTRDNLKSMQDRLADMTQRAQSAPNDQVLRQAPAFSQLEDKLVELSRKIEHAENAQPQNLENLLRAELQQLTGRIDTVRDNAETLAAKAQTEAVQASQKELRIIEERILGLLREAQATFSGGSTNPAELLRLRTDIESLNKRIDSTNKSPQNDIELENLRQAVAQLASRVSQGHDLKPLAILNTRINEIAKRVEQTQSQVPSVQPQVNELEHRIAELDQRLVQAMQSRGNDAHNRALENKLHEVSERMDKADKQLSHLSTIEKAINQLYDGMEASRSQTTLIAEEAARKAIASHIPQTLAFDITAEPAVKALEQGLHAVREQAKLAEGRNQETLEALHETLEHIVGKLSELETAAIGQRMASAVAAETEIATSSLHAETSVAPVEAPQPKFFQEPAQHDPAQHAATDPQFRVEPQFTPDLSPNLSPVQQAAEAVTNPFGNADAFAEENRAQSSAPAADDFIAAARRAAQAAQANSNSGILGSLGVSKVANPANEKKGSFFERLRNKDAETLARTSASQVTPGIQLQTERRAVPRDVVPEGGKRQKLIVMGVVLLMAVSAFTYKMMSQGKSTLFPQVSVETSSVAPASPKKLNDNATPSATEVKPPKAKPDDLESSLNDPTIDNMATASVSSVTPTESIGDIVSGHTQTKAELPPAGIATDVIRQAAATGDAPAQFLVASRFMNGENVDRDFSKAAYWYGKAASSGLAPAQYRVATLYERGKGVDRDMKAALGWYERAAALGNIRAMHNAAVISAGKEAGPANYAKAFKWFSLAASHGLRDSQFNLAVLMERGLGIQANLDEAYFWYLTAAKQNDPEAIKRAAALESKLPPEAVKTAKMKLENWSPQPANESANSVSIQGEAAQTTG